MLTKGGIPETEEKQGLMYAGEVMISLVEVVEEKILEEKDEEKLSKHEER